MTSSLASIKACHSKIVISTDPPSPVGEWRRAEKSHAIVMQEKQYCVYIMMNKWNTTSYIGVTSNLPARIWQHQQKVVEGFTKKYNLSKLVFYEIFDDVLEAIAREKQLKHWSRSKKIALIKTTNPIFDDLSKTLV